MVSLRRAWNRCDCEIEQQSVRVRERKWEREREPEKAKKKSLKGRNKPFEKKELQGTDVMEKVWLYPAGILKLAQATCQLSYWLWHGQCCEDLYTCVYVPACSSSKAWPPVHWWYSLVHEWIGLDEGESLIREGGGGLVLCCRTISCAGTWPRATHKQILRFSYNGFSRNVLTCKGTKAFWILESLSAVIKWKLLVSFQRNWSWSNPTCQDRRF